MERVNPLVFEMDSNSMQVMVVTEQPRGERLSKADLKAVLEAGRKSSVPQRLKFLLGERFCESVQQESGLYYWTHYIKCPGEFRKEKRRGIALDACAEHHLQQEILYLKPSLIISVGSMVNRWIVKKGGLTVDWREFIIRELRQNHGIDLTLNLRTEFGSKILDTRVLFLIHPSERSGLGWFFDKQLKPIIEKEIRKI